MVYVRGKRPSPATVLSIIAILIASTGTAIAALGKNTVGSSQIKPNAAKGKDIKESTLKGVNAAKLGGIAAASYLQNANCTGDGKVRGFARVPASGAFSSSFTPVTGYNCSGGTIEARRDAAGLYEVRFNGNPSEIAVATLVQSASAGFPASTYVGLQQVAAGHFEATVHNEIGAGGLNIDQPFVVAVL
jgi:hypothetical protein